MTTRITKTQLIELAKSKNGYVLNPEDYKNNMTKLLWECDKGHQWTSTWDCISTQGHWCHFCSNQNKKSIREMNDFAITKSGLCLSEQYINSKTKLLWQCKLQHQWLATPDNVINNNRWCPKCKQSLAETKCLQIVENLLDITLNKYYIYVEGRTRPLELDGYNEQYKLAVEYNGEQHYIQHKKFHTTTGRHSLEKQQIRDNQKKEYCIKHGIFLLIVPYTEQAHMEEYIKKQLVNFHPPQ